RRDVPARTGRTDRADDGRGNPGWRRRARWAATRVRPTRRASSHDLQTLTRIRTRSSVRSETLPLRFNIGPKERNGMYSQRLVDAIAEAERLVCEAPHIESEADLLEGLQYLAGGISACTHIAFDYDRDHPFLQSGTGPFNKMGLDNPDTLYFGTRVQAGYEYV